MKNRDIKIDLGAVQETLLLPLWARAKEAEKDDPVLRDDYAKRLIDRIDYDFSQIEAGQSKDHQLVWAVRAYLFDRTAIAFMEQYKETLIVNIGAGLDTAFQRVDDGRVLWMNIDLPDVVALRRQLIPDSERENTLAQSVFDFSWMDGLTRLRNNRSILFMAASVLCYFKEREVELLFQRLAERFSGSYFVFDALSRFTLWGANRDIIKKSGMDASAHMKWHLKKASRLRRWVKNLKIIEEYPALSKAPVKSGWSKRVIWGFRIAGWFRMYNMIHVQI